MTFNPGNEIRGRYRIIERLREGGQAQTYLAEDMQQPDTPKCALKRLNQRQFTIPSAFSVERERFQREARTLERLGSHPQIPKLWDYFEDNKELYLVYEFIEGSDLRQEIRYRNPWTEAKVKVLLQDVLEVLEFVHQNNIIHRDIKPSNLIRRQHDSKICVIDFGVVKLTSSNLTTGVQPGTLIYMAPEQKQGRPCLRSDLYSLGLTAIEALTGEYPLGAVSTGEVSWSYQQVSKNLADVLNKMVHSNLSDRYSSAQEALKSLEPISIIGKILNKKYKITEFIS